MKIRAILWDVAGRHAFRLTFHNWYGTRRRILALFGASVTRSSRLRPTCRISHPWNFAIGEESSVGDHATIDCPCLVRIGNFATISQYAHLSSGGHDISKPGLPYVLGPIRIGDDAWIGADAVVASGSSVGCGAIVGARTTVRGAIADWTVVGGDPVRTLKLREPIHPPQVSTP